MNTFPFFIPRGMRIKGEKKESSKERKRRFNRFERRGRQEMDLSNREYQGGKGSKCERDCIKVESFTYIFIGLICLKN